MRVLAVLLLLCTFALRAAQTPLPDCNGLLLTMHSNYRGEEHDGRGVVYFATNQDREPFKVILQAGHLSYRPRSIPDESYQDHRQLNGRLGDGKYFFIFGPDQELYAAHNDLSVKYKGDRSIQMRHSSFFAGGDVPDSAVFFLKNGRFEILSDDSGHYKPDLKAFLRTVKKLKQMGAPIDSSTQFVFRVVGDTSDYPESIRVDLKSLEDVDPMEHHSEVRVFQEIIKSQTQRRSPKVSNINSLLDAYLTAAREVDSFVLQHLPEVVNLNLEFPGGLRSTVNKTIGRREFYNALARGGPEGAAALKKWLTRLIDIKWITMETVDGEIRDIQSVPETFMDQNSKASIIGLLKTVN